MSVHNRSFDTSYHKPRVEWGSETGVEGKQKGRLVLLKDIHNYRRLVHKGFTFYLSILDTKHPKFIRITECGIERWRMRFNVFTTGFFAEWKPNTVMHLGELHVYYDLISDRPKPWCDDFTFYYDHRKIGTEILQHRYQQMNSAFRNSLVDEDQRMKFMLFLPIRKEDFSAPNKDLDDFLERQDVMLSQLEQLREGTDRTNLTFMAAVKGGVTHTKYLLNLQELESQYLNSCYQRNAYQSPINY